MANNNATNAQGNSVSYVPGSGEINVNNAPTYASQGGIHTSPPIPGAGSANFTNYGAGASFANPGSGGGTFGYVPNVSTTTISNANKIQQVPQMNAALAQASNKGIVSGPEGVQYYSDGTQVPQQPAGQQQNPLTDHSGEDSQIQQIMDQMRASTDAQTKAQIDNIQQKFAQRSIEQKDINERAKKGAQNAILMGGANGSGSNAQSGGATFANVVQANESYGIKQLAALDSAENDAIAQARQAQADQNYKLLENQIGLVNDIRKQKIALASDLNQKAAERNQQSTIDNAITDVYGQGITDVPGILAKLKERGISATAADVASSFKNTGVDDINKLALEASKNGAPLSVIQKIGQAKSLSEATLAAGKYTGDPLDREYKQAQISKIYQDIRESGASGTDADTLIAYANQYASTGTIPPGLPKGTFGQIAAIAKELPKSQGTLIDKNTGIKSSKISTTQEDGIAGAYDAVRKLKELATLPKIGGPNTVARYNSYRNEIISAIRQARSGQAFSASEAAEYEKKVPSLTSFTNGTKIDGLIHSIETNLDSKLSTYGASIYGYSKVKTPYGDRTVGDTITLPSGMNIRVNPDGTVTQI